MSSNRVYFAITKQFPDKDNINKQYKYFNQSVTKYIKTTYQTCYLQQTIEIDRGLLVVIFIASNLTQHKNKSNNVRHSKVVKSKRSFNDLMHQLYQTENITYSDIQHICRKLQKNKTAAHQIRKPFKCLHNIILNKKISIAIHLIIPQSLSAKTLKNRNKLKQAIIKQYECCLLNRSFHFKSADISLLIVANPYNIYQKPSLHEYGSYRIISSDNYPSLSSYSVLNWLCECITSKTSLIPVQAMTEFIYMLLNLRHRRWDWCCEWQVTLDERDPLVKQICDQLTLKTQYRLPHKSNLSSRDSHILLFGFATKYAEKYVPDCIQSIIFDFYWESSHKMSHYTDSGDLWLHYTGDDELIVTVFTDRQDRIPTMISSFVIKQGGVYSIEFKVIEWCRCSHKVKWGIIAEKDIHEMMNRDDSNLPKDVLSMECRRRYKGYETIEMIIDFQSTSVIQCASYIGGECKELQLLMPDTEQLYFPFVELYFDRWECEINCKDTKLQFFH